MEDIPRVGGGGFRSAPLQYNVRGTDLKALIAVSDKMADAIGKVPGIVDVNSTYDSGKPEVNVLIDRDRAADLGVSIEDLGQAIRTLIGGEEVTKFEEAGETYDVRVRLAEIDRDRPESILGLPVRTKNGQYIELRNLIHVQETDGAGANRPAGPHAAGHRDGQPGKNEAAGRRHCRTSARSRAKSACPAASPRRSPARVT